MGSFTERPSGPATSPAAKCDGRPSPHRAGPGRISDWPRRESDPRRDGRGHRETQDRPGHDVARPMEAKDHPAVGDADGERRRYECDRDLCAERVRGPDTEICEVAERCRRSGGMAGREAVAAWKRERPTQGRGRRMMILTRSEIAGPRIRTATRPMNGRSAGRRTHTDREDQEARRGCGPPHRPTP